MIEMYQVKIEHHAALLLHNVRLVDPLDPFTIELKSLTSIKKKTDAILEQIKMAEWKGGMYTDEDGHPIVPTHMLEAAILGGAKKQKNGVQCKSSCLVMDNARIIIAGIKNATIKDIEGKPEFLHRCAAKVGQATVMRTRPHFPKWSLEFTVQIDPEVFPKATLESALTDAGRLVGIGDWRPKFGRFIVKEVKQVK
jgi:hypothetical protein